MAPPRAAAARLAAGAAALALALRVPAAQAQACSLLDHSCLETGCCSTPNTKCFQKNHEAAFCRLDCEPGIHADDPKEYQTPWTCKVLTFGCSIAFQPCEGAKGQNPDIVPCCQTGCICNYTSKYFHQCVPPEGESECSKDGPERKPAYSRAKASHGSTATKSGAESSGGAAEEEDDDDEGGGGGGGGGANCFEVGGKMVGPDCPQDKAQVISDAGEQLQTLGWQPSRLALFLAGGSASAGVISAATAVFFFRRSRAALNSRQSLELSSSEDEL